MRPACVRAAAALTVALAVSGSACGRGARRPASVAPAAGTADLAGTEWLLEDLAGRGVVDDAPATLAFPEAGRVTGQGSCNRFTGGATRTGSAITFTRLAATRRACPGAIMDQETRYLRALEAVERLELSGPYLLLHARGHDRPLRFTRRSAG
jgi:heat shock protein HslJ